MDLLKLLKSIKISFTLDNIFLFLIMLYYIYIILKFIYIKIHLNIKLKTITINGISLEIECNNNVRELANNIWIELSTRKIALPFDEENDVIVDVYNSWYNVFLNFREILKQIPIENDDNADKLSKVIMRVFNQELREHLTKWQARFRKWYEENKNNIGDPQEIQKQYPRYNELIMDIKKVNFKIIDLMNELDKIRKGE